MSCPFYRNFPNGCKTDKSIEKGEAKESLMSTFNQIGEEYLNKAGTMQLRSLARLMHVKNAPKLSRPDLIQAIITRRHALLAEQQIEIDFKKGGSKTNVKLCLRLRPRLLCAADTELSPG